VRHFFSTPRGSVATRKLAARSDSACHAIRNLFGCGDEITRICRRIACRSGPHRMSNRAHGGSLVLHFRPARPVAAKPLQRQSQTQHRGATPLRGGRRQSPPRHSGFGRQSGVAHAARQLHDLLQNGQPPPHQQPGCGVSHDLLDGIQARLRDALGLRQTVSEHDGMRAHAAQGRAKNFQPRALGHADQYFDQPALGFDGGQIAAALGRFASARSAHVLHAQPAGFRRRAAGQTVALLIPAEQAGSNLVERAGMVRARHDIRAGHPRLL